MRINIASCTDIEILRMEAFRLNSVVSSLVREIEDLRADSGEVQCDICGDVHDVDSVPIGCETGDGE